MDFETISRRESRKRRRLSERRRLFNNQATGRQLTSQMSQSNGTSAGGGGGSDSPAGTRSDSPVGIFGDQQRISMKIQFHITVAPDSEPLILDATSASAFHKQQHEEESNSSREQQTKQQPPQSPSIGEQIQEKLNLSRQNSANSQTTNESTRRRQQRLLAMHNSSATTTTTSGMGNSGGSSLAETPLSQTMDDDPMADPLGQATVSDDSIVTRQLVGSESPLVAAAAAAGNARMPPISGGCGGREPGVRSSTISGGMADEATVKFLQRTGDQYQTRVAPTPQRYNSAANLSTPVTATVSTSSSPNHMDKERIYFKRDGQRFGHEFTLKLAVDRTYRCLLKVRPLIPLQSISIQGHQLLFVDCSQQPAAGLGGGGGGSAPNSASGSSTALNQRLRSGSTTGAVASIPASRHLSQPINDAYLTKHHMNPSPRNHHHHHNSPSHNHMHTNNHHLLRSHPISHHPNRPGLYHAQTTGSLYRNSTIDQPAKQLHLLQLAESNLLYRQQQSQMMRHFAASYCSSSNSHLGNQLIYMFDWPASRFEVNKNKNRTEVLAVLKFKNGQILSLPLQVKFYQSDCRQHLEWGSQLHFIDYDCQINQLGQISVDRIQYY